MGNWEEGGVGREGSVWGLVGLGEWELVSWAMVRVCAWVWVEGGCVLSGGWCGGGCRCVGVHCVFVVVDMGVGM